MQKYIAVVNPRMDDDEISKLIAKDIAGALFQISHENYPMAAQLIQQVRKLSQKHNRPISILQDVSEMTDPLDLEFGMKSGADWIVTDNHDHLKMAKGLDRLASVIYKGSNMPKGIRVDSVLSDSFLDPDAQIIGHQKGQVKHLISEHPNQSMIDSLIDIAAHAGSSSIAVGDLDLAKSLSWRRPSKKIVFAPKDRKLASKGAIFWGVHPIFRGKDLISSLRNSHVVKEGDRITDATDVKHVKINVIS
jgi:pyruvate kinase